MRTVAEMYTRQATIAQRNPAFTSSIEWPNGEGYTPCTPEYAAVQDAIDDLNDFGAINMNDMTPENYERYNQLLSEADTMQASGQHLGKSVRY